MKRDLVFSVGILSVLEAWMDPLGADNYDLFSQFSEDVESQDEHSVHAVLQENLDYHLSLLESAGFIRRNSQDGDEAVYYALTWAGHEYLDSSIR